jgi:hypothetical protein
VALTVLFLEPESCNPWNKTRIFSTFFANTRFDICRHKRAVVLRARVRARGRARAQQHVEQRRRCNSYARIIEAIGSTPPPYDRRQQQRWHNEHNENLRRLT